MQTCESAFIYDGDYQLRINKSTTGQTESPVYLEKSFTVVEARTYPTISTSISENVVTFTLEDGDMPVGYDDGTRYFIEINCAENGYNTYLYFEYELDDETILIYNLENGGINGDPGSESHEVTAGTYNFQLSCENVIFYQGTFIIS